MWQSARIDQFLAEEPNLMHACKDVNMTITTESVTVVDMDDCNVRSIRTDDNVCTRQHTVLAAIFMRDLVNPLKS